MSPSANSCRFHPIRMAVWQMCRFQSNTIRNFTKTYISHASPHCVLIRNAPLPVDMGRGWQNDFFAANAVRKMPSRLPTGRKQVITEWSEHASELGGECGQLRTGLDINTQSGDSLAAKSRTSISEYEIFVLRLLPERKHRTRLARAQLPITRQKPHDPQFGFQWNGPCMCQSQLRGSACKMVVSTNGLRAEASTRCCRSVFLGGLVPLDGGGVAPCRRRRGVRPLQTTHTE